MGLGYVNVAGDQITHCVDEEDRESVHHTDGSVSKTLQKLMHKSLAGSVDMKCGPLNCQKGQDKHVANS